MKGITDVFDEDDFDVNEWLDEQAALEEAKDMHCSIYFDPEHEEEFV